ncbi:hypothetical protein Q7P37_010544 [Cladosporium fusiforme]
MRVNGRRGVVKVEGWEADPYQQATTRLCLAAKDMMQRCRTVRRAGYRRTAERADRCVGDGQEGEGMCVCVYGCVATTYLGGKRLSPSRVKKGSKAWDSAEAEKRRSQNHIEEGGISERWRRRWRGERRWWQWVSAPDGGVSWCLGMLAVLLGKPQGDAINNNGDGGAAVARAGGRGDEAVVDDEVR